MEGGTFPDGHLEVLGRLSDRQRQVVQVLGGVDLRDPLEGRVETWLQVAERIVEAEPSAFDEWTIGELLLRWDTEESLPSFVLRELRFSDDEVEQIQALLPLARTQWYVSQGGRPDSSAPADGRARSRRAAPPPAAAERRYTDVAVWAGDIWTAVDTRRGRRVYLRSASRPGQTAKWSERPPRFQNLSRFGTGHWRGYDMAAGLWMYLAHPGSTAPDEHHKGWTDRPPAVADGAPAEDEDEQAPELDEAVQGLVNAVRWEDIRLEDLADPVHHLDIWARTPSLGRLAERAADLDRALVGGTDGAARNEAGRAVARLHAEMERVGSRFEVMDGWPAGWAADRDAGPEKYARMLKLGCLELRGAVRRIARSPVGANPRAAAAERAAGKAEGEVRLAMGGLMNFAWAVGRDRCPSEWFADPLHAADRLSALSALHEGCPDLATGARYVDEAVRQFRAGSLPGSAYDSVLTEFQKLLRRYAEHLFALQDRWPAWDGAEAELPDESPTAYAAMMRLGWQMLEAERQELRTFVGWETSTRNPNMPKPRSPGNARLSRVRARIPKRARPLAPLVLPDVDNLRVLAYAVADHRWPAQALAHPLSWVDAWRSDAELKSDYPEFCERAAEVARLYGQRQAHGETYKDAVAGLVAVLEAVRVGLGLLGNGWPADWAQGGRKVPADSPAVLKHLIDEGKKELRRSARNLALDLRKESAADGAGRRAPGRGSRRGAPADRAGHTPPPSRRGSRRRQPSTGESIRRLFFGQGR
ncbi:hypothetical protein [Streptomyces sp. WAC06614]|uniref:hypothetical protein n=1 Tax=Streptomyces sp. WAC06614 TaxID=2487416 RepID=UPI000F777280|nr:hypothetical protein [Streptomyces sp. WAC06614]RSS66130.1 hypothetical protein EF918_29730 [Streptomyces sp. WAC06614]